MLRIDQQNQALNHSPLSRNDPPIDRLLTGLQREHDFDFVSFSIHCPLPISSPIAYVFGSLPEALALRHTELGYSSPTMSSRCSNILFWDKTMFQEHHQDLKDEAANLDIDCGASIRCRIKNNCIATLCIASKSSSKSRKNFVVSETELISHVQRLIHEVKKIGVIPYVFEEFDISERELQVIKWIAEEKTTREIAMILGVSSNTINFHIKSLHRKLGTCNKVGIVARSLSLGII